jgi:membrane fusion protein (multidrug efflux system)
VIAHGALLAACGGGAGEQGAEEAIPIVARAVGHLERSEFVGLSGDIEAWRTANVGFLVPGLVASVGPREGDAVQEGQVLAQLDPRDYELNLELAAAQRERAEDEHARAQMVFQQNGIPENDFRKAETALRLARAGEDMASKKLADSRLLAPMSGVVASRSIEPGEQAGPGLPIFTLVQIDPLQVRVGVPEADIGRVAVGQRAAVSIPALGGVEIEGRVRLVGVSADPASRTYLVKIEVANPSRTLRPGMIAEVRIETDVMLDAVTIPGDAVVRDADGVPQVFVYFPDEERVYRRRVELGSVYGTEIEIRAGLEAADMVVIGGQHRVREGSLVVAQTQAAADAEGEGPEAPGSNP